MSKSYYGPIDITTEGHMFSPVLYSDQEIHITVVDWPEIKRIKSIIDRYNLAIVPMKIVDSGHHEIPNHLLLKIKSKKIISCIGPKMLKAGKEKWQNQKYRLTFSVQHYKFLSQRTENFDKKIEGLNFNLKDIELLI
jgi:hypothetical protein